MTTPTKGNADILADPDAFRASFERAREVLGKIDGVVGVAFGQKDTGGDFKDDIAIVVFVREKKSEEDLAPAQRIPPTFEGYRTDVRVVPKGTAEACDNVTRYEQIQGGIQIEVKLSGGALGQGTLGCIVKKRCDASRENVYLLTNKHVLYGGGSGRGDNVYHPTPSDVTLGSIQQDSFYGNVAYPPGSPNQYFIDCAIARIDIDSICCDSRCTSDTIECKESSIVDLALGGVNTIADVRSVIGDVLMLNKTVFKVGRTTGRTRGVVRLIGAPLNADPEPDNPNPNPPRIAATNTIEIEFDVAPDNLLNCKLKPNFTEKGDSGSVVVDENGRVIGLHTHGVPHVSGRKRSHACHILPVLDHLNICIPCTPPPPDPDPAKVITGTSHGSSLATDGSGIKPAALPPNQSTLPAGKFVFTPGREEAAPVRPARTFTPMPVTDDEVRHMRKLLAEFRETRLGPQLHGTFADVRREIGYLVRNSRPVKVAWIRNRGPAFFAHVLNHLAGHTDCVPHEVQGVTRRALLVRMREVLSAHGSNPLRHALEHYGDDLLEMLTREDCDSVADCIDALRRAESAGAPV